MLAVGPGYLRHFESFRYLRGMLRSGEVVLDQQLAATLQAQVGDTVSLHAGAGARVHPFKVSGIALVTAPDVLFQPLNPLLGPAPAQPPSNVAIMPLATFATTIGRAAARRCRSRVSASRPCPAHKPGFSGRFRRRWIRAR